jgi:hypothetical protein
MIDLNAMKYISKINFDNLITFELTDHLLDDEAMFYLAKISFPLLEVLDLRCTSFITYEVIKLLSEMDLPKLKELKLYIYHFEKEILELLPNLYLTELYISDILNNEDLEYFSKLELKNLKTLSWFVIELFSIRNIIIFSRVNHPNLRDLYLEFEII